MTPYSLIDSFEDLAGKWRVTLELDSKEWVMLKFQTPPTDEMIQNALEIWAILRDQPPLPPPIPVLPE